MTIEDTVYAACEAMAETLTRTEFLQLAPTVTTVLVADSVVYDQVFTMLLDYLVSTGQLIPNPPIQDNDPPF